MTSLFSFIAWYLAVTLFGFLALPLAFKFFRHLPDRGYAFAKPLGLLTISYVFWLLGSLGFLRNDAPGLLLAAAAVGGLGLVWLGRTRGGVSELRAWLREQRALVVVVELVFLTAFAGWAWVRAYNPEILATEKPMEFMFINSILRSPTFPPNDAWLSGHAISYYYFGYVMVASLARLTGTASAVAFNLGLALLFALTAVGSLGVVMNLVALVKREEGSRMKEEGRAPLLPSSSFLLASFWPGLLGPLLVLVAGNFYGVLSIAHANGLFADLKVPAVWYDFGQARDPNSPRCSLADAEQPPGLKAGLVNVWEWLDIKGVNKPPDPRPAAFTWDPGFWWWFNGARVVHDCNLIGVETEAIDEMPAFSFILGDMHPHVLALPFVILAIALALEWLLWGQAGGGWPAASDADTAASSPRHASRSLVTFMPSLDRLLFSGVVLGGLSFLNTWDFPMYWFLTVVALALGLGSRWGWDLLVNRWRYLGLLAITFAALGVGLYLPFYLTFQSQAGGILPNLIYPTRFQQTVVMFGPVLVGVTLLMGWLCLRGRAYLDGRAALWAGAGIVVSLIAFVILLIVALLILEVIAPLLNIEPPHIMQFVDQALFPLTRNEAMRLLWQRRLVDSLATLFPAVMIGLAAGLGVGALRQNVAAGETAPETPLEALYAPQAEKKRPWRKGRVISAAPSPELCAPAVLMTLAMIMTGALLLLGPEFVYLRDNFGSRMNTIFKFYFQTWVLWGLASAFGVWYVLQYTRQWRRWVAVSVMGLAILGGLIYTASGVYSKTDHFAGPATLDGMAYFAKDNPDDWAAIQWLQQHVPDTPVILEGTKGAYWQEGRSSRISMATGLPTVLGWANHEGQWRGKYFARVADREEQIRTFYQVRDWNTARAILDTYHIEYVIVSSLEQGWYNPTYTHKLDQNMIPVFQSGDVTVYQRRDSQP